MCTSCCVLLHLRVYHIRGGQVVFLLPLALVSPGFCPSTLVELVDLGAVLSLRCALYSRPWGRLLCGRTAVHRVGVGGAVRRAMSRRVVTCCFLKNVAVGCVALRCVPCCCVMLRRIVIGRVVSYGCVVVLCRGMFCVFLCGVGWCRVVPGRVMSRCVLFCGGLLCGAVLCCVVWCCVVVRWVVVFLVL